MLPKNHKYYRRPTNDALHPSRLIPQMPQGEAFYKELKGVEEFFDNTKRVGAGGVTAGSTGLRFVSRKDSAALHERFTETQKQQRKPVQPKANPYEFIGKPAEQAPVRVVSLPSNYCPDCDRAASGGFKPFTYIHPRSRETVVQETTLNMSPVLEPWPAINMRPGDVIRHAICAECSYKAGPDYEGADRMDVKFTIVVNGEQMPLRVLKLHQRIERIHENIEHFLRHAWTIRKEKTFYDEQGGDMAHG